MSRGRGRGRRVRGGHKVFSHHGGHSAPEPSWSWSPGDEPVPGLLA